MVAGKPDDRVNKSYEISWWRCGGVVFTIFAVHGAAIFILVDYHF